jgi:hypothetical protein
MRYRDFLGSPRAGPRGRCGVGRGKSRDFKHETMHMPDASDFDPRNPQMRIHMLGQATIRNILMLCTVYHLMNDDQPAM